MSSASGGRSETMQLRCKRKRERKMSLLEKYDSEIRRLQDECDDPDILKRDISKFIHLPISESTKKGLKLSGYTDLTEIQKLSLPYSLNGRDILGAAKTGSGKTLAFLIPVLETLFKLKWTKLDRLGALIITPTRELAYQIFNVLRRIGKYHTFSAGLLIGGKDIELEKELITKVNILIATPGRLLNHIDQTYGFVYDNLQVLVLDEADRCLDEGFEKTIKAIVTSLPKKRHTLLFSATQKRSLSALALLCLKDPEYISVIDKCVFFTPDQLIQKYVCCNEDDKLNVLYSFLKSHLKKKILVFVSSCKQVRFIYEVFRRLQPGIIVQCLYGRQKQMKRLEVFSKFSRSSSICLISTDIASRGLDFPAVDWVFQLDCPEDTDTYIHRVGRTARYNANGSSILLLSEREEAAMIEKLKSQRIPITKANLNRNKLTDITSHTLAFCTQSPEIKYLAQRAITSYVRAVHLRKDKSAFDIFSIPIASLSRSYGLENVPKIKILKSENIKKNASRDLGDASIQLNRIGNAVESITNDNETETENITNGENINRVKNKPDSKFKRLTRMYSKKNTTVFSEHYKKLIECDEKDNVDDGDDVLVLKRKNHEIDIPERKADPSIITNRRKILKLKKKEIKNRGMGTHIKFDDAGNETKTIELKNLKSFASEKSLDLRTKDFIERSAQAIENEDKVDREVARALMKQKKALKKHKKVVRV